MQPYDPPDREAIWLALYNLLLTRKTPDGYKVMGRKLVQPPTLSPEQQPALFIVQTRETKAPRPQGLPGKKTLSAFLIIYFRSPTPQLDRTGAEQVVGATKANVLLGGIDTALEPDDIVSGRCTLGGLVEHCWIEGDTDIDDGMYSQQGSMIIPIRILVP